MKMKLGMAGLCLAVALAACPVGSASAGSKALQAEIARLSATIDGDVGIAAWRLDGAGDQVLHNADLAFPMASSYKVAIAAAVLARVDAGELELSTMVPVPQSMYVSSEVIADRFIHEGVSLSIHNLIEVMLTQSDNTATDVLMAQAGGPAAVTAWVRRQGVEGQRVDRDTNRLLRDFFGIGSGPMESEVEAALAADPDLLKRGERAYAPFDDDPRDTSTPRAMAMLLTKLFRGEALSADSTALLSAVMERCRTCDARLRGRMPAGTTVADKSGTIGGTVNDVGVVTLPDGSKFAIAAFVMRSNVPRSERERVIAEIARTVRDYFLLHPPAVAP